MNSRCLIVCYGELFLKGRNRPEFVQKLTNNINLSFQKNNFSNFSIRKLHDQLIITAKDDKELPKMIPYLKKVFGISTFFLAYQLENDYEKLCKFVESITDYYEINFTTFKFDISRSDKTFPKNSLTLQKELGEIIVKKQNLKVKLNNPQTTFYIRIHHQFILFFIEKIKGLEGLPVGSSGKILLLLSGGIDSPVAAYQLMKRGLEVVYLHFYHEKKGQEKIFALSEKLSPYNNFSRQVYLVDAQPLFTEISHISQAKYRLIILKRMFIRCAGLLARKLAITALATGDSLAQVASQTLESLGVIQQASITVFEPVKALTQKAIELHHDLERDEKGIINKILCWFGSYIALTAIGIVWFILVHNSHQWSSFYMVVAYPIIWLIATFATVFYIGLRFQKCFKIKGKIKNRGRELERIIKKLRKEKNKQVCLLTPLISWDKKEIIEEARRIGTYELSLKKYEDCCSLFEPKHPITKPRKEVVEKLEEEILWLEVLAIIDKKISESLEKKL